MLTYLGLLNWELLTQSVTVLSVSSSWQSNDTNLHHTDMHTETSRDRHIQSRVT